MGTIEVDMFSEDVNDLNHPQVVAFHELLEEVAHDFHCHLLTFHIDRGTVSFSFDDDELTAKILKIIQASNPPIFP
jgi:hypothetical protein